MTEMAARIDAFVAYAATLAGDEKGEAQVFCDRLFRAFGHDGYKEAGATLEARVRRADRGVGFADLIWPGRALIEMKKRGEPLARHRDQAFDYWIHAIPKRPRYVVLCNFDELWVYDFDTQIQEPVDRVPVAALAQRYTALNFLFPHAPRHLRAVRTELQGRHHLSLRNLYRALDKPGRHPLRDAQDALDVAVAAAYVRGPSSDALTFLLELNRAVAAAESRGERVQGPGLPAAFAPDPRFQSSDCIQMS